MYLRLKIPKKLEEIHQVDTDIEAQRVVSTEENHGTTKSKREEMPVPVEQLTTFMKKRLGEVPGEAFKATSVTIFRLPGWIHEYNRDLCEPMVVAIGPYHHGKESLRTTEEHKWSTLRDFLVRYQNIGLEDYLREMKRIEIQARRCYSETVKLTSDEFLMMLLLDGCFILEYFLKFCHGNSKKDAICGAGWANGYILSDMFLLENQLPFFVIHNLFTLATQNKGMGCTKNCKSDRCLLLKLFDQVWGDLKLVGPFKPPNITCSEAFHLLHLYYKSTVPDLQCETEKKQGKLVPHKSHHFRGLSGLSELCSPKSRAVSYSSKPCEFTPLSKDQVNIPCVAELHDANVKFKRKDNPRNLLDISFENGTIEMPILYTENSVVRILWNMVAFEQSQLPQNFPQIMSSYLALMDSLINTDKDVAILEKSGILHNFLENAEEPAEFFNQFSKNFELTYSDHYFHEIFKKVKKYSESTWHKNRARLMQDYFSNPWAIISVLAAGTLLSLTFIQTYYSVAK